jgi:hypothetical protein
MFNILLLGAYTGRLWHLPGVYVAAGQKPSQQFQFDANLLGIDFVIGGTSSAYLSSLKIFHRSFRMDKVSKLTLIEPIFSHLRKEVYTPGLAQIIFAFLITHYLDWLYHHQSVLDASITEKWWSGA